MYCCVLREIARLAPVGEISTGLARRVCTLPKRCHRRVPTPFRLRCPVTVLQVDWAISHTEVSVLNRTSPWGPVNPRAPSNHRLGVRRWFRLPQLYSPRGAGSEQRQMAYLPLNESIDR